MIQHRNTAERGLITEHDVFSQPPGTVADIVNFRIVHIGGNRYRIISVKGTVKKFSLNPNYRAIAAWDCGDYAVLLSTNGVNAPNNGEIGILEFDGTDYLYTPLYNHKNLGFQLFKYAQVRVYKQNNNDHQAYWWNNQDPPKMLNIKNSNLYDLYLPATTLEDGVSYMVTSGRAEYPVGSTTFYGPNEAAGTVFTAVAPDLNYADPLATSPRVFVYSPILEMLDLIPKVELVGNIEFVEKLSSGDLKAGMWFYFLQYEYNNEVRSSWSPGTTGIHLNDKMPIVEDWTSFLEYQGQGGQTNIPNDYNENTTSGIKIRIDNIDTNFTRLRIAAVRAMDWRIIDQPVLVAEVVINGQASIVVDHTSNRGILPLSDIEMIAYVEGILANKTGDLAKRYLFLGNIKTRFEFEWEPNLQASLTPIVKDILHDSASAEATNLTAAHPDSSTGPHSGSAYLPLFGHKLLSGWVYANVWYNVTGGTIEAPVGVVRSGLFVYDGSGPNLHKAEIVNPTGTPVVEPVIIINMYGSEKKIIPFNDWYDQKGMAVNHYLRGRFRTETYRIGIMLDDLWGIPYGACWLGDIAMPGFFANVENTTDPDNPVTVQNKPLKNFLAAPEILHFVQSLGIQVDNINFNTLINSINQINGTNYTISELDQAFRGFRIVVAPRDEQVIAQGIVYPTFYYNNDGDKTRVVPMGAEGLISTFDPGDTPLDGNLHILRQSPADINGFIQFYRAKNVYELLSPELLLNFNNDQPDIKEGDYVEIMAYVLDGAKNLDEHGTIHTDNFHLYSKYYVITDTVAGNNMVPIGETTEIDVAKSESVAELGTPIVQINGIDVPYENKGLVVDWVNNWLRAAIGGKKYLLKTKKPEDGTVAGWINGISYHGFNNLFQVAPILGLGNGTHLLNGVAKCIVNIKRPKSALYGGISQSAIESTIYMPTGHYQRFDGDFITHLLDTSGGKPSGYSRKTEIYGGDCYVGFFDFQRFVQWGNESETIGPPMANFGLPKFYPSFPFGTNPNPTFAYKYSNTTIFPVETKINLGLREGRHSAKDRSIGYLDMTQPGNPEGVAFGAGQYDHPENLRYNEAYSTDFSFSLFPAKKKLNFYNSHFPNRYIWSGEISPDSIINPLRRFSILNRRDVAGVFGEIVMMRTRLNKLFYWQQFGSGYIGVDERAMIPSSLGQTLAVGAENAGERFDQTDEIYGLQHQLAFTDIPSGFSWYDHHKRAWCVMTLSGETARLDVINPNQSMFGEMDDVMLPFDNPLQGEGFVMNYNHRFDEIMLSIIPGEFIFDADDPLAKKNYAIGYNATEKIFSVRMTNAPAIYINFKNKVFTQRDDIYTANQVQASTLYEVGDVGLNGNQVYHCITEHTTPAFGTIFITANWQLVGEVSDVHLNDVGKPSEFYGVTKQGLLKFIVNPSQSADEEFVFYNFKFNGMTEDFFRTLRVRNSYQDNQDDNLDLLKTGDYKYRDRKWESNVPLDADNIRLVDGYMELILISDNRNVTNGVRNNFSNDENFIYLTSIITTFRKEF